MMHRRACAIIAMVLGMALVAPAGGAATVTGTVLFEGEPPEMRPLDLGADPQCAAMHKGDPPLNQALVLGEGQTMGNILMSIQEGLPEGEEYPVPDEPFVLHQDGCQYSPHVFGIRAGQELIVTNFDGILHNVHAMPAVNDGFNLAMPSTKKKMTVTFEKPEAPFPFRCDVHPWMNAYCAVFEHPYFDVTEKDGKFEISGLEPGEYTLQAWHEKLGPQQAVITIEEKGTTVEQDFTFSRP